MARKKQWTAEEIEDRKNRRRAYAYNHFLRTRCAGNFPTVKRKRYKSEYYGWVRPLVGDPILLGPASGQDTIINKRVRLIHELISAGNAREFDIIWLHRHENELPQ